MNDTEDMEKYGNFVYTDDYNDSYTCDFEETGLQNFHAIFQSVFYSFIFFLGLAGNGLMITILLRRQHRLRITEIYLLHLALADLMLIITLPFKSVGCITGWVFGEFLCILTGVLENLNLLCVSFLLACIGFDRYLAIVHAVPSMQSRRPRVVHLTCMSLWLFCLLLSLPNAVFLSVKMDQNDLFLDCHAYRFKIHSHNWVVTNRVIHNVCFFFSLGVMCYCYTALVVTLCSSQKSQSKKAAIRLALLVTLVFCCSWLPYSMASLIMSLSELKLIILDTCDSEELLKQVYNVSYSLGISHCCLNPFLYAFVGVQFRNELIHLLCQLGCGRVCSPFIQVRTRSFVSDGTTNSTNIF
ncbi:C-X-C chemokine receptor type 5 [Nothobranchius furzeri]|uniref:C-X-C motif chemokine receptor 5 n=2 Tax=Nothobranchius TaxID=28779 RepID=A0A8C6KU70_NOTFU|nr:C-X-C chemokine receptor type 5 [Nothobranchius furzeri]KAF7218736.1 C-X-C motif chemokine receptor 5 [Nothobranchius furzeri]